MGINYETFKFLVCLIIIQIKFFVNCNDLNVFTSTLHIKIQNYIQNH